MQNYIRVLAAGRGEIFLTKITPCPASSTRYFHYKKVAKNKFATFFK